jgi:hypothetical protein
MEAHAHWPSIWLADGDENCPAPGIVIEMRPPRTLSEPGLTEILELFISATPNGTGVHLLVVMRCEPSPEGGVGIAGKRTSWRRIAEWIAAGAIVGWKIVSGW